MNKKRATILLKRFYLGETTVDEEHQLISYLLSGDCPTDLKVERHAVISLAREEAIRMPKRLKQKRNTYWQKGIAATILLLIGIGLGTLIPKDRQTEQLLQREVAEVRDPVQPVQLPIPQTTKPLPKEPTVTKSPRIIRVDTQKKTSKEDTEGIHEMMPVTDLPLSLPLSSRRDDLCRRIEASFPSTSEFTNLQNM